MLIYHMHTDLVLPPLGKSRHVPMLELSPQHVQSDSPIANDVLEMVWLVKLYFKSVTCVSANQITELLQSDLGIWVEWYGKGTRILVPWSTLQTAAWELLGSLHANLQHAPVLVSNPHSLYPNSNSIPLLWSRFHSITPILQSPNSNTSILLFPFQTNWW